MRKISSFAGYVACLFAIQGCDFGQGTVCKSDSDCGADAYCHMPSNSCVIRESLTFLEPTSGAKVGATTRVRIRLFLGQSRTPPATLTVTAQPATGAAETVTLTRTGESYEGTFTPQRNGAYTLQAAFAEASLSQQLAVTADLVAPTLTFDAVTYPTRMPSGQTSYVDIDPGFVDAFKRSERATFRVRSTAADVAPASVRVTVYGFNGTGRGASLPPIPVNKVNCPDAYCGDFSMDFSAPELVGARGTFELTATAADDVGNTATTAAPLTVRVTRFAWVHTVGGAGNVLTAPALSDEGLIFFGNSVSSKLHTVRNDGTPGWDAPARGPVTASPAIGAGPNQRVYFAVAGAAGPEMHASVARDGSDTKSCTTGFGTTSSRIPTGIGITTSGGLEAGLGISTVGTTVNGRLGVIRPGTEDGLCTDSVSNTTLPAGTSSIVTIGQDLYFGNQGGEAVWMRYEAGTWVRKQTRPVGLPTPMAIADALLVTGSGTGTRGLALDLSSVVWTATDSGTSAATFSPVVGEGNVAFYGASNLRIVSSPLRRSDNIHDATNASVIGPPLVGEGGYIYVLADTMLSVRRAATLRTEWTFDLGTEGSAGLAIDCARFANGVRRPGPGRLLIPTTQGKMFAIDVDSRGLNTSSPWPKYQRDPRNTGNANVSLAAFACP